MSNINEYIQQGSDETLINSLSKELGITIGNDVIQNLDFMDYVALEMAVKNKDKNAAMRVLGLREGSNPYDTSSLKKPETTSSMTSAMANIDLKKGDPVTFKGEDDEVLSGEVEDPTSNQIKVKTDTGSINVNKDDLSVDPDAISKELDRMKQLAGIASSVKPEQLGQEGEIKTETTHSGGATSGAITSGAIAGANKGLNWIKKMTRSDKDKKPGPKPKKK